MLDAPAGGADPEALAGGLAEVREWLRAVRRSLSEARRILEEAGTIADSAHAGEAALAPPTSQEGAAP